MEFLSFIIGICVGVVTIASCLLGMDRIMLNTPPVLAAIMPFKGVLAIVGLALALGGAWCGYSYRDWSAGLEMQAEKGKVSTAAAKASEAALEKQKEITHAYVVANDKWQENSSIAERDHARELARVRNAAGSVRGIKLPGEPTAPGLCPEYGGPKREELLRKSEELIGLVRDADRVRAALISCESTALQKSPIPGEPKD